MSEEAEMQRCDWLKKFRVPSIFMRATRRKTESFRKFQIVLMSDNTGFLKTVPESFCKIIGSFGNVSEIPVRQM